MTGVQTCALPISIAEIIVAHHVAMVARRGITVTAIVAVFAHLILSLRPLIAPGFARLRAIMARLMRLKRRRRRGLQRLIAGRGRTGLCIARRAAIAIPVAAAIATPAAAFTRHVAFVAFTPFAAFGRHGWLRRG